MHSQNRERKTLMLTGTFVEEYLLRIMNNASVIKEGTDRK